MIKLVFEFLISERPHQESVRNLHLAPKLIFYGAQSEFLKPGYPGSVTPTPGIEPGCQKARCSRPVHYHYAMWA